MGALTEAGVAAIFYHFAEFLRKVNKSDCRCSSEHLSSAFTINRNPKILI